MTALQLNIIGEGTSMTFEERISGLPGIVAATAFLRLPDGRINGSKIQELYGLKLLPPENELYQLVRTARLLVLNSDHENFRKWLRTPNAEFDGITPYELIETGHAEIVADLVQDILTNRGQ